MCAHRNTYTAHNRFQLTRIECNDVTRERLDGWEKGKGLIRGSPWPPPPIRIVPGSLLICVLFLVSPRVPALHAGESWEVLADNLV